MGNYQRLYSVEEEPLEDEIADELVEDERVEGIPSLKQRTKHPDNSKEEIKGSTPLHTSTDESVSLETPTYYNTPNNKGSWTPTFSEDTEPMTQDFSHEEEEDQIGFADNTYSAEDDDEEGTDTDTDLDGFLVDDEEEIEYSGEEDGAEFSEEDEAVFSEGDGVELSEDSEEELSEEDSLLGTEIGDDGGSNVSGIRDISPKPKRKFVVLRDSEEERPLAASTPAKFKRLRKASS